MPPNDSVTEMMTGERETVDLNILLDEDGEPVADDWEDNLSDLE